MIKVLRIINRFNLGGPTYNVTFLSGYLSEEFTTRLIGGAHEEHEGESLFIPDKYGVKPEIIQGLRREINLKKDKAALREIRQIIKTYKPDIVHTHASKAGALGRYAAFKENVPIVVHTFHGHVFHSYFGTLKTYLYKMVERYLAKKSDAIISISNLQKKELSEIYKIASPQHIRVIPLGFDLDKFNENKVEKRIQFRNTYKLTDQTIAIGIIGRLTAIKNHEGFLKSIGLAANSTKKDITLFIVGDGELMEPLKLQAAGIEAKFSTVRIIFTSWIKDVDRILPGLDILCLASFNEGTPVSLIEAQAAGVAVISTNVGGVKDVVLENETGLVVDGNDPKQYAEALLDLIENEEKREKMSQNGWAFVKDKFHYKRLCSDIEDLYLELLEKKKLK